MQPMMNRLTKLLALNRSAPRDYKIEAAADGDSASIYLYDVIGYDFWSGGGVTAKQFARDLQALNGKALNLHINSPGGDVFEGRAMAAALQSYSGKVVAHIDGLAASAASALVMHADEIVMMDGSFMMIHNGWTVVMGDRHSLLETAGLLEKIDASIIDDYSKRATADREQLAAWMDAETWFTATEAVDNGFADRIATTSDKGSAKASAWNLAAYEHPPEPLVADAPEEAPEHDFAVAHEHRLRMLATVETHPA